MNTNILSDWKYLAPEESLTLLQVGKKVISVALGTGGSGRAEETVIIKVHRRQYNHVLKNFWTISVQLLPRGGG